MTVLVVDTGILVKTILDEADSERAAALLDAAEGGFVRLHAPEFGLLELANVLFKTERRGDLSARFVEERVSELPFWAVEWHAAAPLLGRALGFARATGQGVYDGAFLALAERLGGLLVTADRKLLGACARSFRFVVSLEETAALLGEP